VTSCRRRGGSAPLLNSSFSYVVGVAAESLILTRTRPSARCLRMTAGVRYCQFAMRPADDRYLRIVVAVRGLGWRNPPEADVPSDGVPSLFWSGGKWRADGMKTGALLYHCYSNGFVKRVRTIRQTVSILAKSLRFAAKLLSYVCSLPHLLRELPRRPPRTSWTSLLGYEV
jgi:hypothetical protein